MREVKIQNPEPSGQTGVGEAGKANHTGPFAMLKWGIHKPQSQSSGQSGGADLATGPMDRVFTRAAYIRVGFHGKGKGYNFTPIVVSRIIAAVQPVWRAYRRYDVIQVVEYWGASGRRVEGVRPWLGISQRE